ncbi:O-succinylhomoserine sulfhydrylase [Jannaschia donghaensis]|uniref:O-succinylhomoserine sulfhydrylase n=1 Tax=Jannaschia donghaensis TaxID=420998 RepID=A0A0M6YLK5_9RHOB|nr:O-succinylhomoserine sulfhydrylase [Jannaschia donghaensis]CTQ50157.1 O-succinylhomoserine sulfhydrylase [Jannaschia donghaensis]
MKDTSPKSRKPRTNAVHAGTRRSQYGEVSEAMFLTQGFVYPTAEAAEERFLNAGRDDFIYARYGNPTVAMFEDRIAALEATEDAFACASGMAAVNGAMMSILRAGDHVVAARALFGSCLYILEEVLTRFGVEVTLIDGTDLSAWQAALRPDTKVAFFETISNPTLEVIDIAGVADLAHAVGALVVVDNVFATPTYSRALELGADVIVYSTTKHIDGQGRCLGGVICGKQDFIRGTVEPYLKHTGGSMSPFNAWVMLKGLEHLDLRVHAQTETATRLAANLTDHPKLTRVLYPHDPRHPQHDLACRQMDAGGTVLSFEVAGGREGANRFLNALDIVIISNNLGDAKTIATPPYSTTHQRLSEDRKATLGITPGLIRLSCGLEDTDDLIDDILTALDAV